MVSMINNVATSQDFSIARSQFRAGENEPLKFDGVGISELKTFLLVGALLNDKGALSRNDEAFLYAFMRTCIELGFSVSSKHKINVCTIPDHDFLWSENDGVDAVLFCNIFNCSHTTLEQIASETEPLLLQSEACNVSNVWSNALENTGACIAGNVNGSVTLATEKLTETKCFLKVKLPQRVDIQSYDLDIVAKPNLRLS